MEVAPDMDALLDELEADDSIGECIPSISFPQKPIQHVLSSQKVEIMPINRSPSPQEELEEEEVEKKESLKAPQVPVGMKKPNVDVTPISELDFSCPSPSMSVDADGVENSLPPVEATPDLEIDVPIETSVESNEPKSNCEVDSKEQEQVAPVVTALEDNSDFDEVLAYLDKFEETSDKHEPTRSTSDEKEEHIITEVEILDEDIKVAVECSQTQVVVGNESEETELANSVDDLPEVQQTDVVQAEVNESSAYHATAMEIAELVIQAVLEEVVKEEKQRCAIPSDDMKEEEVSNEEDSLSSEEVSCSGEQIQVQEEDKETEEKRPKPMESCTTPPKSRVFLDPDVSVENVPESNEGIAVEADLPEVENEPDGNLSPVVETKTEDGARDIPEVEVIQVTDTVVGDAVFERGTVAECDGADLRSEEEEEKQSGEGSFEPAEISVADEIDVQINEEEGEREGLHTAIECASSGSEQPSPSSEEGESSHNESARFESIATVHDLGEEAADSNRLTESERMLGKQKPYWIPDSDCHVCMLCSLKFSLLLRRHHCRACGRVLCAACCSEKAELDYMKEESKKPTTTRICSPCANMLIRIAAYEESLANNENAASSVGEEHAASSSRVRGVLKTRGQSVSENTGEGDPVVAGSTESEPTGTEPRKRSVMFRDGVAPGSSSTEGGVVIQEKSTAIKPKKKSRKRSSVVRRIAELKLEEELSSALPSASLTPQKFLILSPSESDSMHLEYVSIDSILNRLRELAPVTLVLKKNLSCVVQICKCDNRPVWCVSSRGFASIGLDEIVFVWQHSSEQSSLEDVQKLPVNVFQRNEEIYTSACDSDVSAGVCRVSNRLPSLHSSPSPSEFPLTKHVYFFPPTVQDVSFLPSLPSSPYLFACFVLDCELPWIMSCPNRVLFRLGLQNSWYPTPVVNIPDRKPVFSKETSQTVLKVFTDFRTWSYRMQHVTGSTVTLENDKTTIRIPKSAKNEINAIVGWNRSMLAWGCDVNKSADSHLVCDENDGLYSTQVLARGASREATGTSFVILDGALKSMAQLQVSVVEDGVAVRLQPETFNSLIEKLVGKEVEDFNLSDNVSGCQLSIEWVEAGSNATEFSVRSNIDGMYLGDKYQYGLSLERVLTSVLQVNSAPDYGIRLSHVYNLREGRLSPEEEPRVFSVAEMVCRECCGLLDPFLLMLVNMNICSISIRVSASSCSIEYDVSPWVGMEQEQLKFRESMDPLIPVLYEVLNYLPAGFEFEIVLSFVSTKSLPLPPQ